MPNETKRAVEHGVGFASATATAGALGGAGYIAKGLFDFFTAPDAPDGPALAKYEARGEISSEVAVTQWVVGRARVSGALVRHADVIFPTRAHNFFTTRAGDYPGRPTDLLQATNLYMEVLSYLGHVLSAGPTNGIKRVWVDGVRLNIMKSERGREIADGEWGPAAVRASDRKTPFFDAFFERLGRVLEPGDEGYPGIDTGLEVGPSIAFWTHKGDGMGRRSLPATKLRSIYVLGNASDEEKADVNAAVGDDLTWVLTRLRQGNNNNQPHPWKDRPLIEFLVEGRGHSLLEDGSLGLPTSNNPVDVADLLDGNPAKTAYWFLRERMGVDPALIDDVWRQSLRICDEPFVIGAIKNPPEATDAELNAARNALTRTGSQVAIAVELRRIAEELGITSASTNALKTVYDEYHCRRLDRVVRRFTGRDWYRKAPGLTSSQSTEADALTCTERRTSALWVKNIDDSIVDQIVAKWNLRFTGSEDQFDGSRPRYRANGVIPSTADPMQVLDALAQSMAGSIVEHGGVWHVRAGSLSVRPGNVITDEDIVDGLISQQLEPSAADQPFELRAGLLQNERLEYERFVMEPVDRVESNVGEIDATNRLPVVVDQVDATVGKLPTRSREMGEFAFVTDPLQADELMRIALYQSRWNTRTISLTTGPGDDFKFHRLSRGEPVLLNVKNEDVMGETVGERVDSMRCIVVSVDRLPNGNVALVLRQQDEETFGEKFGLVFDYNDAGDVLLVPPPPPPTDPPTCSHTDRTVRPGTTITNADGWQVVGTGGTGRLTYGLSWSGANPGISIDSTTGHLTGQAPTVEVNTTYRGRVSVTDSKGRTGSCRVELRVNARPSPGDNPWIEVTGLQAAEPQETTNFRAVMRFPQRLSRAFQGADSASWRFRLLPYRGGGTVPSGASITTDGVGTWRPATGTPAGTQTGRVVASASGFPTVSLPVDFETTAARTKCAVTLRTIQVKRGEALSATSIFSGRQNVTGNLTVSVVLEGIGRPSPLPDGLDLSTSGMLSGTTTVPARNYRVEVNVRDQNTDATKRECEQSGVLWVEVQESDTPPSCEIEESNFTVKRSGIVYKGVKFTGFSGTIPVPSIRGPSWLTIQRNPDATSEYQYRLRLADGRPPSTSGYGYAIRSGRAACGGTIIVEEDPPPPLRMSDVRIETLEGTPWSGGMNATGGAGALSYAWEGAEPTEEIGLVLGTRSGDFSGTAPSDENAPGTYGPYVVRATKGEDYVDANVTAVITTDPTPPPLPVNCTVAKLVGRPGDAVNTSLVDSSCTGDGNLAGDHATSTATDSTGTAVAGWTGTWDFSDVIGDPNVPGTAGIIASFSTVIPAGQALGVYKFTNTVRSDRGGTATVEVEVTVAAVPIAIPAAQLSVSRSASSAFARTLTPSGGPRTGSYVFARAAGQPGWITLTADGRISWAAQNQARSGTFRFTVTKGSQSKTFDLAYRLTTGGGTGPVDPEEEETIYV